MNKNSYFHVKKENNSYGDYIDLYFTKNSGDIMIYITTYTLIEFISSKIGLISSYELNSTKIAPSDIYYTNKINFISNSSTTDS
jgi:hypothetical protein